MITTACKCADDGRTKAYGVKDANGSGFIYIEYHATSFTTLQDPFKTDHSEARRLFYGADTFTLGKWLFLNGVVLLRSTGYYRKNVDSLLNIFSPLAVNVGGSYSATNGRGTVDVEIIALDTIADNDLVVEFALYEKGPIRFAMPGSPDTCVFRYILVELLNNEKLTIANGETVNLSKDFAVPDSIGGGTPPIHHKVDFNNIGIAIFIQSTGSKKVLQAASHNF